MEKSFYRQLLKIALPIALAQFFAGLLGVVDTLMVSTLGDNAVAAVGIASNVAFLLFMVNWGLLSGFGLFIAQYYGVKDIRSIHKVFIVVLGFASVIALVFFIGGFFFPEVIIGIYNNSSDTTNTTLVAQFGQSYMRTASLSYLFITFTQVMSMLMRNIEDVVMPQTIQIGVVLINTLLNFFLIQGRWIAPALGVQGAALATVISSFIGLVTLGLYMLLKKNPVYRIQWTLYRTLDRRFLSHVLRRTLPVLANETFWGLGMSMILIAFGFISPMAVTSLTIANQVMGLIWFANGGLAAATAIMLGHRLGDNQLAEAKQYAARFVRINLTVGLTVGVLLFILSTSIASAYSATSETVQANVVWFLRVYALYLPIKFMNALHIVGTLRAGGDTVYALVSELLPLWGFAVPLVFVLSLFTALPLVVILVLVNLEEVMKLGLLTVRYRSGRWIQNLTQNPPEKALVS